MTHQRQSVPDGRTGDAGGHRWLAAAFVTVLPFLIVFGRDLWHVPFPIDETVGIAANADILSDAAGAPHEWLDPTLTSFLNPDLRNWFRPLFFATFYLFWHATHSLDTTLFLFRLLEVGSALLLVIGFVWIVKPGSFGDYAASTVALAVLVGPAGFRMNLEFPVLFTLVGMVCAIGVWLLLERQHRAWHGPALVVLTAVAVGFKEQGLVLVPIILGAWWFGAPGVRRRTAITVFVLTIAYLGMRFTATGEWHPFEQDVAIGFETIPASDANARFGEFPYGVYAYNAAATVGNVLFSEPSDGAFRITRAVLEQRWQPWQLVDVLTSVGTTALLGWWALATWRRERTGLRTNEWRMLVALVLAVAATGALGFNYSRERLGGMAVVFYALAAYHAFRHLGRVLMDARHATVIVCSTTLALLAAGWQLRALGTADFADAMARRNHRTWVVTLQQQRVEQMSKGRARQARILEAMAPQGQRPVPARSDAYEHFASRWLGTR